MRIKINNDLQIFQGFHIFLSSKQDKTIVFSSQFIVKREQVSEAYSHTFSQKGNANFFP